MLAGIHAGDWLVKLLLIAGGYSPATWKGSSAKSGVLRSSLPAWLRNGFRNARETVAG